eukprot:gene29171-biopygen58548
MIVLCSEKVEVTLSSMRAMLSANISWSSALADLADQAPDPYNRPWNNAFQHPNQTVAEDINAADVQQHLAAGGSFRLGVSVSAPFIPSALRDAMRDLEDCMQCPIGVNLYVTGPSSQTLHRHVDAYDVLVVQLGGSKKWTMCSNKFSSDEEIDELFCCNESVFNSGDVVFVPEGILHWASEYGGGISAHLT